MEEVGDSDDRIFSSGFVAPGARARSWLRIRVDPEPEWLVFIQTNVAASIYAEIQKFKTAIFICNVV